EDPVNNKNKSTKDLGLRDFKETEIRSGVSGSKIILTQSNIAQMLKLPNKSVFKSFTPATGRKSSYQEKAAVDKITGHTSASGAEVREAKSTEDNTTTETVATGTDGASEAHINKGKKPVASASVVEPDVEKPQEKIV
ncbi:hypothetical protein A2U01_0042085, partial [Trifolium medium]|nr:hypothetical protein [Trifolium medium]